jgi:hypothetical protein
MHDVSSSRVIAGRAQPTIDDYAERTKEIVAAWKSIDGKQGGDPAKLAALKEPPTRFAAGADAVQVSSITALLDHDPTVEASPSR